MLELVGRFRGDAAHVEQSRVRQPAQRPVQVGFRYWIDRMDKLVGKFATDYGADLDEFLGGPKAIDSRHQRVMQGRRNLVPGQLRIATLEHRPRQLLDEQR